MVNDAFTPRRSRVRSAHRPSGFPATSEAQLDLEGTKKVPPSPAPQEKTCSLCAEPKPLDAFNRDRTKRDGRQSLCRECQKGNYSRGANRERHLERTRQYKAENPQRRKAHRAIEYAIAKGRMIRGFCECCGNEKADAHHWKGYDKPLDVQWLCRACHVAIEPRRGAA